MNYIKIILITLFSIVLMGCEKVEIEDVPTFDRTEILSFKAYAKDKTSIIMGNPVIDTETSTITVQIQPEANLSEIFATCTLTSGSTISPIMDGYQDWSAGSRTFTVISGSGKRTESWEIRLQK